MNLESRFSPTIDIKIDKNHSSERLLEHYVYIYMLHFAAMDILDIVLTNL